MFNKWLTLRFIGSDGSMGLIHGRTYRVQLSIRDGYFWVRWHPGDRVYILSHGEPKECPYRSLNTFAQNWALETDALS